ncbi:MAG: hypothetical protein GY856_15850 [bacterium]|nr:hypothetical protein [bacterium]
MFRRYAISRAGVEELGNGETARRRAAASGAGDRLSLSYGPTFDPEG